MTTVTGILHTHSTHSYDGKVSLRELKALLQAAGHSFACMTEHTDTLTSGSAEAFIKECRLLSDESFVFVPGFEVPYGDAHVLHFGAEEYVCAIADAPALRRWRAVAPLVVLAHPVRNRFVVDDTLFECIDGIEVWNQQYEGKALPRHRSLALLETLRMRKPLLAFGGIDLHRAEHLGTPVTTLKLETLSESAIIKALQSGQYVVGSQNFSFSGYTAVELSIGERLKSRLAIGVITAGKLVNAGLAKLGVRLPKKLVRAIRSRV